MNLTKLEPYPIKARLLCLLLSILWLPSVLAAQNTGSLKGHVFDPTGALIPGATITLTRGAVALTAASTSDGNYQFKPIPFGTYELTVDAAGFTRLSIPEITIAGTRQLNLSLSVYVEQEHINVTSENTGISLNSY
jgi:hypothetical protein